MKNYTFEELWERIPKLLRDACANCEQDPKWHPEGPVDIHNRLVFEHAKKYFPEHPELLVCAILHDLGKPETQRITELDNGKRKITNYGHERAGLKYIDKYFDLFSDITTDKETVYGVCQDHMRIHLYNSKKMSRPFKRKALEDKPYFDLLVKFCECDEMSREI